MLLIIWEQSAIVYIKCLSLIFPVSALQCRRQSRERTLYLLWLLYIYSIPLFLPIGNCLFKKIKKKTTRTYVIFLECSEWRICAWNFIISVRSCSPDGSTLKLYRLGCGISKYMYICIYSATNHAHCSFPVETNRNKGKWVLLRSKVRSSFRSLAYVRVRVTRLFHHCYSKRCWRRGRGGLLQRGHGASGRGLQRHRRHQAAQPHCHGQDQLHRTRLGVCRGV